MTHEPLTVTAVCRPLPGGRLEASFETPHAPFRLTTVADNLDDIDLVVSEIVSALAYRHADDVTVDIVLDTDAARVTR